MNAHKAYTLTSGTSGTIRSLGNVDNDQLVNLIVQDAKAAASYVKKLAPHFKGSTTATTLANIYTWVATHLKYKEDGFAQVGKMPPRLLADGVADCKSLSIFCSSILQNLNIPHKLRFVSYEAADPRPSHVYLMVGTTALDPTMAILEGSNTLGKEVPYKYKKDFEMTYNTINGIPLNAGMVSGISPKRVLYAPARAAYIALLRINFRNWAYLLYKYNQKHPTELKNKWQSGFGGNYADLLANIDKGRNKRRILGYTQHRGVNGPQLAAILASAATIMTGLSNIIATAKKETGVDENTLIDNGVVLSTGGGGNNGGNGGGDGNNGGFGGISTNTLLLAALAAVVLLRK